MAFHLIPQAYAQPHNIGNFDCVGAFCPATVDQIDIIASMVFGFLTIVGGLAFLIWFLIGGLGWLTAGGDKAKVESAKNTMTNAAIGMIVMVAAYGIAWVVGDILGVDILNPAELISNL